MRILLCTARMQRGKKPLISWKCVLWKYILNVAIFFYNQRKLNRLLLLMAYKKLGILFLCVKIVVMNLRMTAIFPRAKWFNPYEPMKTPPWVFSFGSPSCSDMTIPKALCTHHAKYIFTTPLRKKGLWPGASICFTIHLQCHLHSQEGST